MEGLDPQRQVIYYHISGKLIGAITTYESALTTEYIELNEPTDTFGYMISEETITNLSDYCIDWASPVSLKQRRELTTYYENGYLKNIVPCRLTVMKSPVVIEPQSFDIDVEGSPLPANWTWDEPIEFPAKGKYIIRIDPEFSFYTEKVLEIEID